MWFSSRLKPSFQTPAEPSQAVFPDAGDAAGSGAGAGATGSGAAVSASALAAASGAVAAPSGA
eukprot:6072120-Prymnesium_polylepis.1